MKTSMLAFAIAALVAIQGSSATGAQAPPRPPTAPAPAAPPAPPSPPPAAPAAPVPPIPPVAIRPFTEPAGPVTPLRVQVTISRYQGDRKVSSLPYVMIVNANEGTIDPGGQYRPYNLVRLRTGSRLPVAPSVTADSKDTNVVTYQAIGTNIDSWAMSVDNNRFRVTLSIDDSSIYPDGPGGGPATQRPNDRPSYRSFQSNTSVILRDKQTTEFTAAADKITGEVTRIEVTLTVEK